MMKHGCKEAVVEEEVPKEVRSLCVLRFGVCCFALLHAGGGGGAEGISDKEAADKESNQEEGGEGSVAVHCCIQALMPACIDDV